MATAFTCPHCEASDTKVVDSRPSKIMGRITVRRRRYCCGCGHRFTTFEVLALDLADADRLRKTAPKVARLATEFADLTASWGRTGVVGDLTDPE